MKEKEIVINQKVNLLIHKVLRKHFDEHDIPNGEVEVHYLIVSFNDQLLLYVFNKEQPHIFAYKAVMTWLKADKLSNFGGGKLLFIVPKDKKDTALTLQFTGDAQYIGPPEAEKAILLAKAFWPGAAVSLSGAIQINVLAKQVISKIITKQNDNAHKALEIVEM